MGERAPSVPPEPKPPTIENPGTGMRANRTKPTHIEITAVTEHIEEKKLPNGEIEEDTDVLVLWKEHTTRIRPIHAYSGRVTF